MKLLSVLLFFIFSFACVAQDTENNELTTKYFFIRHAEKDLSDPSNRNPDLTNEGNLRATSWAKMLADTKIDIVFSTDYTRTRQTAKPIAKNQGKEIILYNPRDLNNQDFVNMTQGKTSVIVGHSNTTPYFVNKILGYDKYQAIDEKIYGKLYIVTIKGKSITDTVLTIH
ncbi:histidine phosphatase family protein [Aquimarina sp. AU474]|uniref:SixA phosphatase family protein n=1 Tax=Aquimarina sp. AU474 TaxID=2108529 RepID=UPI00135B27EC|nr:phosphoglycerate mutase family protein [Aquimarina sp. AU474]